jgi:hypothetical protein
MGWKAVFIWCAINIDFIRDVDDDRFLLADAFPPVIDPLGDLNQKRIVDPDEELVNLPFGRRAFSGVIKDQFDHSPDGADVIGLDLMIVPGLHHMRIGGGDIHLAELQKQIVIRPEDLQHSSPLIRDHPQTFRPYPLYHLVPLIPCRLS